MWYSVLLLGHKPVQHVTVLNTVDNCNTIVCSILLYCNIIILQDHRRSCGPSLTETSLCIVTFSGEGLCINYFFVYCGLMLEGR